VSIYGSSVIVGAQYDNQAGALAGADYVFAQTPTGVWSQDAKLIASDATPNEWFGSAVAISGTHAVVGASGYGGSYPKGAAYMFERGPLGWAQVAKLVPSDVGANTQFGASVAISGDYAIIGTDPQWNSPPAAAYIFERNQSGAWVQAAKLQAPSGAYLVGSSVSISGSLALVGGYTIDAAHTSSWGAVYVFGRDSLGNWVQTATLTPADPSASQYFGWRVATDGNRALVGAMWDDAKGNDSGAAYVFEPDGTGYWLQKAKLTASDGDTGDVFGISVALSGDTAIIGANSGWTDPQGPTAAYVFELAAWGNWEQTAELEGSPSVRDYFGEDVSISGNYAVVGAYADNTAGALAGAAYVYTPEPATISLMALGVLTVLSRRRTAASWKA
jgi:hypothetical protein